MEEAVKVFQKVLDENNLTVVLVKPVIRFVENGGVIIEQPQLRVTFTVPPSASTATEVSDTIPASEPEKQS